MSGSECRTATGHSVAARRAQWLGGTENHTLRVDLLEYLASMNGSAKNGSWLILFVLCPVRGFHTKLGRQMPQNAHRQNQLK